MHEVEQSICARLVPQMITKVVVGLQGDDEGCCQDKDQMIKFCVAA